jgi:hypothetical protein
LARGAKSPAGPTQEGHPDSQLQPTISSRVCAKSNSCARYNGSEKPIPPGYPSNQYKFGSKNSFSVLCIAAYIESEIGERFNLPFWKAAARQSRSPNLVRRTSATMSPPTSSHTTAQTFRLSLADRKGSDDQRTLQRQPYEVVCILFSGNCNFPAPIFIVKTLFS